MFYFVQRPSLIAAIFTRFGLGPPIAFMPDSRTPAVSSSAGVPFRSQRTTAKRRHIVLTYSQQSVMHPELEPLIRFGAWSPSVARKTMKNLNDIKFADRLNTSAKARAKQLERARAQAQTSGAGAAARAAASRARAVTREDRLAAKAVAASDLRVRQLAEDAARAQAAAVQEKELADADARDRALQVEKKAARDARYAARKARGRK